MEDQKKRLEDKNNDIEIILKKIEKSGLFGEINYFGAPGECEYEKTANEFTRLFYMYYELFQFKSWFISNTIDYYKAGKTPCFNKEEYKCNDCAIQILTPWRSDISFRCPIKFYKRINNDTNKI